MTTIVQGGALRLTAAETEDEDGAGMRLGGVSPAARLAPATTLSGAPTGDLGLAGGASLVLSAGGALAGPSVLTGAAPSEPDEGLAADGPAASPSRRAPAPDDFNGDGTSDILLSAYNGGGLINWLMADAAYVDWRPLANAAAQGYGVVGTGDFDGDGQSDLMLRTDAYSEAWHVVSENYVVWSVRDGEFAGGEAVSVTPLGDGVRYRAIGAADVNGDGIADLLMAGDRPAPDRGLGPTSFLASLVMDGNGHGEMVRIGDNTGWETVGIGDFDGDGVSDVLMRRYDFGLITWVLRDGTYAGWNLVGNAESAGYGVLGTGDFNGDGTTDLLLANGGNLITWLIEDGTYAGWSQLGNMWWLGGLSFEKTGDYNGDGTSDILFTDRDGRAVIWTVEEAVVTGTPVIGSLSGYSIL